MSDVNIVEVLNMAQPKRAARELEAALREAGIRNAEATADCVYVRLGEQPRLEVKAVSAGHGRPQEVRDALAHFRTTRADGVTVFVAAHFTKGAVELLEESRVNYLDDCQFVLRIEDPFVAIKRDRECQQTQRQPAQPSLGGRIGVAVQEMLLDDRQWWRVTDLAVAANVAAGTAQAALRRLEDAELIVAEGIGPRKRRRVLDRAALLERWVADARKDRNRLLSAYVYAQGPGDLARVVSARLTEQHVDHAVTGATAALLLAPHATDVRTCEVWVDSTAGSEMIAAALGTPPVEKGGNVVILRAKTDAPLFRAKEEGGVVVANALRVYADLMEDPKRGQEQAQFLRESRMGF